MPVFTAEYLINVGARIFAAAGSPSEEARTVASLLVEANVVGHDSHGVIRIPQYMDSIERGEIAPGAEVEIVRQTAVTAVLDGHWGYGQMVGSRAVGIGLAKAGQAGLAAITIRNSNHVARLGSYVDEIARQDMIGMLFTNAHGGGPSVVPWGGTRGRLGTNPLAVGLPRASGEPLVLDMTTSVVAEGKVRVQRNRGEPTPDGWIVDVEGRPTNDPNAFYGPPRGGILPFGGIAGHKGYGLGVAVDMLAGALSGAGCTGSGTRIGNAALLLVLNVAQFTPLEAYYKEVEDFVEFVKSSPTAGGFDEILMPGEIEMRQKAQRQQEGIFVEDETWKQVVECGRKLGAVIEEEGAG